MIAGAVFWTPVLGKRVPPENCDGKFHNEAKECIMKIGDLFEHKHTMSEDRHPDG